MFEEIFLHVLQRHAPIKQKVTRANHAPYVTKAMRKAVMKTTQLQHRYFKNRSRENFNAYKHQRKISTLHYINEKKRNILIIWI